jgi:hypothetical protein
MNTSNVVVVSFTQTFRYEAIFKTKALWGWASSASAKVEQPDPLVEVNSLPGSWIVVDQLCECTY